MSFIPRKVIQSLPSILCFSALLGAFLPGLPAQQNITTATVAGRVEDGTGAAVSGAAVHLTNVDRNQISAAETDDAGRFRFSYLPAGSYELRAGEPPFRPLLMKLNLSAGQVLDVPLRLVLAPVKEEVLVTADAPLVETARTQIAETVLPAEVDTLPLNGRNYLDLALLVPGVSRTNTGSNQLFAETSAVPGTGISVASQRNLNNSFLLDGISANDDAAGLAGSFYSQEVVREFHVLTSGGVAEFGRASGGVVNIITKSGTNDWRHRLYGFARNQRFDARNPLASREDPLSQAQYGGSSGGPIQRDRTFLYTNFEQTRQNRAGFITITPGNVEAVNRVLGGFGLGDRAVQTGEFPTGFDSTNYFARLDHRLNDRHQLTARYSIYDISSENARSVGGLNALSRGSGLENRDQTFALNEIGVLSNAAVNEFRFQFTRSRLAAPINDSVGPAINISGVASLGSATFSPEGRNIDLLEASDSVSMQRGAHALKFGGNFLYNRVDILFPGALQGVYTFPSLDAFRARRYINFQQAFGEPSQFQSNPNLGLFVQDEWRVNPSLTLNLGLRYDAQWLPDPIGTDTDNLAPRFGLAYAPWDRKTVLRASYGLYYDRIPLRATSNALQRDGTKYRAAVLSFGQSGAPAFPQTLRSFPEGVLPSITTIDPNIENSYSQQANFQVERELSHSMSVSAGYLYLRGLHLIMNSNVNVPTLSGSEATALGIANLGRPDPRYGNVSRFQGMGDSYFNGMVLSFRRRAARWGDVRLSYTLSKAIDTAGNFFFSRPQNNFDIGDERGLSDNDQRHRLTLSGHLDSPLKTGPAFWNRAFGGFRLSYIYNYNSALPFNIRTGTDRNHDTNVNDRPVGVGRNTGRGFDSSSLDLRLSRAFQVAERFRIEAIAETFNTVNRTNFQFPNPVFGPGQTPLPSFGRPTGAGDARQIQFGLRFDF